MTTHAAIASDTYRMGAFTVQFVLRDNGRQFEALWLPKVPPPGSLSDTLLARYRRLRDAFVADYAQRAGVRALVVDL
jgi:hypothetical protein